MLEGVVLEGTWDLEDYAYHGVNAALVAGLDQQLDVCVHEGNGHGHLRAIWQDKLGVLAELLDEAEDVIPAAAVEAGAVVAKFVDDLRGSFLALLWIW